jgi:hypothetical protein
MLTDTISHAASRRSSHAMSFKPAFSIESRKPSSHSYSFQDEAQRVADLLKRAARVAAARMDGVDARLVLAGAKWFRFEVEAEAFFRRGALRGSVG